MKRFVSFVLVLAALLVIAPETIAQQPVAIGTYMVKQGDTAWELAGKYYADKTKWTRIVDMNPFLQEPGRVFERGNPNKVGENKIVLILHPGESLIGLERLEVEPPKAVPINQLVVDKKTEERSTAATTPSWWGKAGFWIFLAVLVAFAAWLIMDWIWSLREKREHERAQADHREEQERLRQERERELRRDPITSGPPMVPGGIAATDTPRLTNFFDQQAVNRYAERNPTIDRTGIRPTRIGPIEEGTIVGEGLVGYLGTEFRARRIEQPLAAYRARYRFPDSTEEELITLQACMNPVIYGGDTYRGFTFTPRTTAVPTPEPERPAPQAIPHPAIAVQRIRTAAEEQGASTILVGGRMMTIERGAHLDLDSVPGSVRITGAQFEMTVKNPRVKKVSKTTRATGTSDK